MAKFYMIVVSEDLKTKQILTMTPYEYVLFGMWLEQETTMSDLIVKLKMKKATLHKILLQLSNEKYIISTHKHIGSVGRPELLYKWNENIKFSLKDFLKSD